MARRRLFALLLGLSLIAAACGSDDGGSPGDGGDDGDGQETEAVRMALVLPGPSNDFTWNQAALEGAQALVQEGVIDLEWVDNVGEDAQSFIPVATGYAEQGAQLVIAHTFDFGEPTMRLAPDYPDTNFAWSGSGLPGDVAENVADYPQPFYQGAYIAGVLMAGASQTGKIGGIAGFDIPACHSMMESFREGAELVNPDIEMVITYLGTWFDPAKEKEGALAQYDQGVDVIGVCGVPTGVIEAAKERGLGVVGYVGDQAPVAPENVLTSVRWDLSVVWRAMAEDVAAGTFQPGKTYDLDIRDEAIVVIPNPDYAGEIDPAALDKYEEVLAGLQSGEIEAPYIPE